MSGVSWPRHRARCLASLDGPALRALPDKDKAVVVVPTGAIEQHGPHLPVAVDSLMGAIWSEQLAARLPDDFPLWFAPPITIGKSNEHTGFPGTLMIGAKTLHALLGHVLGSLHALGFRRFLLLNTHGGNSAVLRDALRAFHRSHPGVIAEFLKSDAKLELSPQESLYGFHANEAETAFLLAEQPGWMRPERAVCAWPARIEDPGELRPENAPAIFSWVSADLSPSGVMGDATVATAEKGRRWIAAIADGHARHVREVAAREC